MKPIFAVGQLVWVAQYGQRSEEIPCPVCSGKKEVVVILGSGEHVVTPCSYCGSGYEGPRGVVTHYTAEPRAQQLRVATVTTCSNGNAVSASYLFDCGRCADHDDVFATESECLELCQEKAAQRNREIGGREFCGKENATKSFAWHVGYHKREAKEARRKLEHHESRAISCAAKAKKDAKP